MPIDTSNYLQVPAFRQWFGNSVVKDEHGNPLICYHGTRSSFHEFSHEETPHRGGLLAFFSSSPQFASDYATVHEGANVIPVFLNIEHPFDFRSNWSEAEDFWQETGGIFDQYEIDRILVGLGYPIENIGMDKHDFELTEELFIKAIKEGSWDALEAPEFVHWLRQYGCDGLITTENGAINWGIFEPNQVKSVFASEFNPRSGSLSEMRRYIDIIDPNSNR